MVLCFCWVIVLPAGKCSTLIEPTIEDHSTAGTAQVVQVRSYLERFSNEFAQYQISGKRSTNFEQLLDLINSPDVVIALDEMPTSKNPKMCLTCLSATQTFLDIYTQQHNREKSKLVDVAQQICHLYTLKSYVCDGLVSLNADMMMYILSNMTELPSAERVCEIAYQGEYCVTPTSTVLTDRYPKVKITPSNKELQTSKQSTVYFSDKTWTIIHLTDIHYDPDYVVGINADCQAGACCRHVPDLGPATKANAAGFWGDYRDCDSPWAAVVDVMEQIQTQHPKIDAVYFTGDIVHHFTWNTTLESNEESMRQIFQLLKERFAGIPVYPILGNHEAHPANLFAPSTVPESLTSKYLYDYIIDEWSDWLPVESVQATLSEGGYYSVLSPLGHRIVALNNNPCFVSNWWLLHSDDYFLPQLQWLHDTLLAAEKAGEIVHILAHVPSYDDYCYVGWTREYRRIVERFAHIIEAQFNGHSHVDEFNVYYKKSDPSAAINVAWNGGSTTTFTQLNPNYKVFHVDRTSFEIVDIETWIYNLTEANEHPERKPNWVKAYDFRQHYGLDNVSPSELDALLRQLASNEDRLLDYWKLKQKLADPMLAQGCDRGCLKEALCALARTEFGDESACERLLTGSKN